MCQNRDFILPWDFATYCTIAHANASNLKENTYALFPSLRENRWEVLYAEKTQAYLEILNEEQIELMPGADFFLQQLEKKEKSRCVVTNSSKEQITIIKEKIPILRSIPHFITREAYQKPKPDPECYLLAIEHFAKSHDRIIGFEDSFKGLMALAKAGVDPVLISSFLKEEEAKKIKEKIKKPFYHYHNLLLQEKERDQVRS